MFTRDWMLSDKRKTQSPSTKFIVVMETNHFPTGCSHPLKFTSTRGNCNFFVELIKNITIIH